MPKLLRCTNLRYFQPNFEDTEKVIFKMQNIRMKWPRHRRVISLEIQVGITSRINKWAITDHRKYRRWDQMPRRSKHPLSTGRTRREPSSIIVNAELSAVKVSVPSAV
jgi:hypothetical protein